MKPSRKMAKKLEKRVNEYDKMTTVNGVVGPKSTDKFIKRGPDAYAMMHRPGSNKKRS